MSTAALVDKEYRTIVNDLKTHCGNIEPFLLIRAAMLRQKYPSEHKQHYWLELHYREDVDVEAKSASIFHQVGKLPSYHGHYHFALNLQAGLDTLLSIAADDDIELITGDAFPIT